MKKNKCIKSKNIVFLIYRGEINTGSSNPSSEIFLSCTSLTIQLPTGYQGFLGGSVIKNPPANEDVYSIPGSGRSHGGNGNPLQSSCLRNPMDRGAWWATVHRVTKILTQLGD